MMDSLYEEGYVETLLSDIRLASNRLEDIGFHSLVLIASGDRHFEIGSAKGMQFSLDNFGYIENFMEYCQDTKLFDLSPTTNEEQGSKDSKRVAYKWHIPELKESYTETGMSDIKAEGDSELESDVDHESLEHGDDSEDDTKPDTSIVVINMNKKKKSTGTKIGSSSRTKPNKKKSRATKQDVSGTITIQKVSSRGVEKKAIQKVSSRGVGTPYECDQCEKRYLAKKDLIIHKRIHSGDTPFQCPICSKGFRSTGLLREHKQMHNTEKCYPCDVCGQLFLRRNSVYRHKLKVHSETRPCYVCDICGHSFEESSVLRMHKLRHEGYKPHSCPVCGRSFLEKRSLIAHQLIHTGEKPYKCETCGEGFRMKKNMVTHQKRKHLTKQPVIIRVISANHDTHEQTVSEESTE